MANDGSLASLTEDWIVAQIVAIPEFAGKLVEPYPGSVADAGAKLIAEFLANRDLYATVLFESDTAVSINENVNAYDATYAIYIAVQNKRKGASRRGDGSTVGTNLIRDLLRNALHNKTPALSANGFFAETTEYRGVSVVFQRADAFIMRAELRVREGPTP